MTTILKILGGIVLLYVAIQIAIFVFNFFNPWVGILLSILIVLGIAQLCGLINLKNIKF